VVDAKGVVLDQNKIDMKRIHFVIFFAFCTSITLMSCHKTSPKESLLKQEYIKLIEQYIDEDSLNHTSYMILPVSECIKNDPSLKGFLIGPLYRYPWQSFKEERCYQVHCYKGKRIYLLTNIADLLDLPINQDSIEYCQRDSCLLVDDIYAIDACLNYFKRAWLMTASDGNVISQKDIDSLFLPKIKKDLPCE
jgi:hypothetical protein